MSISPRQEHEANAAATMELLGLAERGVIYRAERNQHGWWAVTAKGDTPTPMYSAKAVMAYVATVKEGTNITA